MGVGVLGSAAVVVPGDGRLARAISPARSE